MLQRIMEQLGGGHFNSASQIEVKIVILNQQLVETIESEATMEKCRMKVIS